MIPQRCCFARVTTVLVPCAEGIAVGVTLAGSALCVEMWRLESVSRLSRNNSERMSEAC